MKHSPRTLRPKNHSVTPIGPRGTGPQATATSVPKELYGDPVVLRATIRGIGLEIQDLEQKRDILMAHLTAQGKTFTEITPREIVKTATVATQPKPRRPMSAAGREAIRQATKARWARFHKQQKANGQKRTAA